MRRSVVAVVTGFTRCAPLAQKSIAPLVNLKRAGIIDRILYVTWDRADIDAFVAPVAVIEDVETVRVAQPHAQGGGLRTGTLYQIANLAAALQRIDEPDALVVKLRPDFIVREEFLRTKIEGFETLCAPGDLAAQFGVAMPPSPFAAKIWLPWADAGLPLHYEDAAFMGLRRDIDRLADAAALDVIDPHLAAGNGFAWLTHVARFVAVFGRDYPFLSTYARNHRLFVNEPCLRADIMAAAIREPFYAQLAVLNAWILASCFHIDCGLPGDLTFYSNSSNPKANWSDIRGLKNHPPYNAVDAWRAAQCPGGLLPCLGRIHARLVDDSWQTALFARDALTGVTPEQLRTVLRRAAAYNPGVPDVAERAFYAALERVAEGHLANAVPAGL